MMINDPIADMLTRIRNIAKVGKSEVMVPMSKMKWQIATVLQAEGYLESVEEIKEGVAPTMRLVIKYANKKPSVSVIRRISKPGRRVYVGKDELPHVLNDLGIAIVSTSKGVMTNRQARQQGFGGELICEVY